MAQFDFNANDVEPSSGFGAVPAGEYELYATEADIASAKSGNGEVLSLTYEILSGEFKGRKIWERMNIVHNNPVAQKIGQETLSALCRAVGVMQITDTEELLWREFTATVKVEQYQKNDGSTDERNSIKKYHFTDGAPPIQKAATQAQPHPAIRTTPAARPASSRAAPAAQSGRTVPWGSGQRQQQQTTIDDNIPF